METEISSYIRTHAGTVIVKYAFVNIPVTCYIRNINNTFSIKVYNINSEVIYFIWMYCCIAHS